jgi:hypothetical protein
MGDTSNEYLIGYHFKQGQFYKQDTILHRSRIPGTDEDGRISVGLRDDRIFQDRYLFCSIGILVDLHEKKLVWEKSNLSFVEEKEGKLYFNRSFFNTTLDLYEYDLTKQTYKNVLKRPFEGYCFRPELVAPDYNHFLETTYESPGKAAIILVDSTGKKRKLAIASKLDWRFSGPRANRKMPIAWIDRYHFVFHDYIVQKKEKPVPAPPVPDATIEHVFERWKPDSLPCCSVELTEIDIRDGSMRFITTINGLYEQMVDDRIYKSAKGDLVFRNRGADTTQQFRINRLTGETKPDGQRTPGFTRLSSDPTLGDDAPDDIFFKGSKIGTFHVYSDHREDSVMVILGGRKREDPESIFVWSTGHPRWQQLPVERFLGFFGWINKPSN